MSESRRTQHRENHVLMLQLRRKLRSFLLLLDSVEVSAVASLLVARPTSLRRDVQE